MAILKRKRISKKNKKSWRKHVDIKDVDAFLEDQRTEECFGWTTSELPNTQYFYVDTKSAVPNLAPKQKRRLQLREKPLKNFALLEPHTKVKDPITKRNRVRTKEERKNLLVKKKEGEERLSGRLKAKEIQSQTDKFLEELKRNVEARKDKFEKDIWDIENNSGPIKSAEWLKETTIIHNEKRQSKMKKQTPKSLHQRQSILPSVEIPHPGLSYNPSFEDHQELLKEVVEKETGIIKQEEHLNRVTKNMFKKVSRSQKDAFWITEMSEGLKPDIDGKVEDAEISEQKKREVKNKKKTLKQRRKQREHLEQQKLRKIAKMEKRKVADIDKLRFISKQVEGDKLKEEKLEQKRKIRHEKRLLKTKRLCAVKFEDPNIEFVAGQELSGNLRNIKKNSNFLADRFKSFQKRNMLEPGLKRTKKRAKVKSYVKPDHKEGWKSTVARYA